MQRRKWTLLVVMYSVMCIASAENLVINGDFDSFSQGTLIIGGTSAGTVSTSSSGTGYDEVVATAALPYYADAAYRTSFSRNGYVIRFTSGALSGQTSFVTNNVTTDLKTDTALSFEGLSTLPSAGDTFALYTAKPAQWLTRGGGATAQPPVSRSTDAKTGTYSLRIDDYGTNTGVMAPAITVTAGTTYTLSYWCKASNIDGIKVGATIRDGVNSATVLMDNVIFATTADNWEYRELEWTASADGTVYISTDYLRTKNKNQWVEFDAVSFSSVPEPVTSMMLCCGLLSIFMKKSKR